MQGVEMGTNNRHRTVKFKADMKWVEPNQQWYMYNKRDSRFIMNLFDCANIHRVFPGLKKDKNNTFEVVVKHVEK